MLGFVKMLTTVLVPKPCVPNHLSQFASRNVATERRGKYREENGRREIGIILLLTVN
jgi:hypothetical protein